MANKFYDDKDDEYTSGNDFEKESLQDTESSYDDFKEINNDEFEQASDLENQEEVSYDYEQLEEFSPLPTRSEIHREKRSKTNKKQKVKYPIIKILAMLFIFIPVILLGYFNFFADSDKSKGKSDDNTDNFDTIDLSKEAEDESIKNILQEIGNLDKDEDEELDQDKTDEANDQETDTSPKEDGKKSESDSSKGEKKPDQENKTETEKDQQREANNSPQEEDKKPQNSGGAKTHTVKENETLYRIAMNYFNSPDGVEKIKSANNLRDDTINVGQVLKIPNN